MYYNRFQQGDEVSYAGSKVFLADDGKPLDMGHGVLCARVGNSEQSVVVDFGHGAYVMNEQTSLKPFVKRPQRPESQTESRGGPEVVKRRGMGDKPAGGKRRGNQG